MGQIDFIAQRWLKAFLHRRGLDSPDGRQLFRYNCSGQEHEELKALLKSADLGHDVGRHVTAAFVLHASECFRKDHVDGAWTWRTALDPIGRSGSTTLCQPLKDCGLAWWKRPIERRLGGRKLHMFTLVSEGGFPTGLLVREQTSIRVWLSRLLQYANAHDADFDQCSAAAAEFSGYLPQSMANEELNQLGAELALAVKGLRAHIAQTGFEDPLLALSTAHPGWRDEIPLQLDDAAARELLRGLVTLKLDAPLDLAHSLCTRGLVRRAEQWLPILRIEQEGRFRIDQAPPPARAVIGPESYRARLIAAGALSAAREGEIALLEKEDAGWRFRALPRAAGVLPFPFEDSASVQIRLAGRYSEPFVVMGGAAVDSEVLVFRRVAEDELALVGSGSFKSSDESVFVAVDPSETSFQHSSGSVVTPVGRIGDGPMELFEISGACRIFGPDGLNLGIRTGTEDAPSQRVTIIPRSPPFEVSPEPASLGTPRFLKPAGLPVANRDVRWRRLDAPGEGWKTLEADGPIGAVRFEVVRDGEIVERFRSTVLPETASIGREARDEHGGRIRLSGFAARDVVMGRDPRVVATVTRDGADWVIDLNAPPDVTLAGLSIHFTDGGHADLRLDIPRRGACFVDADGRMLPRNSERSIDELSGVRLLSDGNRFLAVDLRSKTHSRRGANIPVGGSLPLSGLVQEFRANLAETSDQDACLVLESESARLVLRRYPFEMRRLPDGRIVATPPPSNALRGQPLRVVALPLRDPDVGERELWAGDGADLPDQQFSSPDPSVPWICFVERRGRAISRPSVFLANTPAAADDDFGRCVDLPVFQRRTSAMAKHLAAIAADPNHRDWMKLRSALRQSQGRLALASLDWFTTLAAHPGALAAMLLGTPASDVAAVLDMENELPFLWETIPLETWTWAAAARKMGLAKLLGESSNELVQGIVAETLDAIASEKDHLTPLLYAVGLSVGLAIRTRPGRQGSAASPVQEFLVRNAERNWPVLPTITEAVPPKLLVQYAANWAPVIYAPSMAARVVSGELRPSQDLLLELRTAKRFDQVYFESAFGCPGF